MEKWRPHTAEDSQAAHRHVCSKGVRDEIDLMPEIGQRANAMKLTEGRAARLEERLGRDHQNAHVICDFRMKS